jgi:hypothetical protein
LQFSDARETALIVVAEQLARLLSEGTWTHDHPITFETAKGFGLPVRL